MKKMQIAPKKLQRKLLNDGDLKRETEVSSNLGQSLSFYKIFNQPRKKTPSIQAGIEADNSSV